MVPNFLAMSFKFVQQYQIDHHTSNPYHLQSNGMVEKAVQIVKRLMKKARQGGNDPYLVHY